ncbi:flagellar basal body rod protein FlgB [Tranquillimonas alkanivorans]|uniref:Flagellar basal body rod protein FlgB n=1 Tax=Tranquillimonas alkanivorans TaxID=441119 RepID=A0A1I5S2Y1_9RHOB|nr:flagellar basal body protein [Tranquillimonas alkanivorans]SFP65103.1 flagellar basal-body rod protein FlgB [Tranquillimonas alkanivorans]
MKLDTMSFFRMASDRMSWLSERQKVISQNVANADTPGYKARDVGSFQEMVEGSRAGTGLARTHEAHRAGSLDGTGVRVDEDRTAWEQSPDGNTVVLEQQTIRANEVAENYRLAAQLYRKGYELLSLAASSNR